MGDRSSDSESEEPTISEDVVVTKYKMAGDMANRKFVFLFAYFNCVQGQEKRKRNVESDRSLLTLQSSINYYVQGVTICVMLVNAKYKITGLRKLLLLT